MLICSIVDLSAISIYQVLLKLSFVFVNTQWMNEASNCPLFCIGKYDGYYSQGAKILAAGYTFRTISYT